MGSHSPSFRYSRPPTRNLFPFALPSLFSVRGFPRVKPPIPCICFYLLPCPPLLPRFNQGILQCLSAVNCLPGHATIWVLNTPRVPSQPRSSVIPFFAPLAWYQGSSPGNLFSGLLHTAHWPVPGTLRNFRPPPSFLHLYADCLEMSELAPPFMGVLSPFGHPYSSLLP